MRNIAHTFIDSCVVPDFRSSNGLFNTLKSENKLKPSGKHLFDASVYQTDDSTSSFHDMVRTLSKKVSGAAPTAFHQMLATLASEGRLLRLYTQNVDGIDTSLPPLASSVPLDRKGPWPRTIQLHGSLENMVCSKCNSLKAFDPALFDGPVPPLCTVCVDLDKVRTESAGKRSHGIGRLRPRMVLYNEHNPDDEAIGFVMKADLRARPDAVIVVGTSMEIPGVKRFVRTICGVVRARRDGVAIWINRGPPPIAKEFDGCWDLVVAGACDEVARLAKMRRWNDEGNDYKECTESEAEQAKLTGTGVQVVVKAAKCKGSTPRRSATPNEYGRPTLTMTPAESPKAKAVKLPNIPTKIPPIHKKAKTAAKGSQMGTAKRIGSKTSKLVSGNTTMSKTAKYSGQANINFKVTKRQIAPASPMRVKLNTTVKLAKLHHPSPTGPEKARRLLESLGEPVPMALLSPNSAKSNGPLSSTETQSSTSKLAKVNIPLEGVPLKIEIPSNEDLLADNKRLKRMSGEIVSPTGSKPSGMANILH